MLGLDGRGHIGRFADYTQWEEWVEARESPNSDKAAEKPERRRARSLATQSAAVSGTPSARKKLSYLEAREFAGIEERVEQSDLRLAGLGPV